MAGPILTVNRRTTLRWLGVMMAASQAAACGDDFKSGWPTLEPLDAKGYGSDPKLDEGKAPWPLTMTKAELLTAATAADLILPAEGEAPAPSQVGVPAFLDEWVSAPYESQQKDRALIIPGLAWLDRESRARNGGLIFAKAKPEQQKLIFDDIAFKDKVKPGLEKPAEFFRRFRALTLGAFYTTQEGWADIGYLGNDPTDGPYPGPTPEAIAHMKKLVESMGLKFTPP